MKTILLLTALFSSSVFAANYVNHNTRFTVSDIARDGSRVYYNCDSVENQVESVLTKMGAIVNSVRCSGGLNRYSFPTRAFVTVDYDTLSSQVAGDISASIMSVELKDRNNCHLNNSIFKAVQKNFEISNVNIGRCFNPSYRTRINAEILKTK